MLKIHFGIREGTVNRVRSYFKHNFEAEWLDDPLIKEMVFDVDKSKVLAPYCIESPVFGQIAPERLSGGVQALILMAKTDFIINASKCGDNCAKWILKIAEQKDLEIDLEHIMSFGLVDFNAIVLNDNSEIHSYLDYLTTALKFI